MRRSWGLEMRAETKPKPQRSLYDHGTGGNARNGEPDGHKGLRMKVLIATGGACFVMPWGGGCASRRAWLVWACGRVVVEGANDEVSLSRLTWREREREGLMKLDETRCNATSRIMWSKLPAPSLAKTSLSPYTIFSDAALPHFPRVDMTTCTEKRLSPNNLIRTTPDHNIDSLVLSGSARSLLRLDRGCMSR